MRAANALAIAAVAALAASAHAFTIPTCSEAGETTAVAEGWRCVTHSFKTTDAGKYDTLDFTVSRDYSADAAGAGKLLVFFVYNNEGFDVDDDDWKNGALAARLNVRRPGTDKSVSSPTDAAFSLIPFTRLLPGKGGADVGYTAAAAAPCGGTYSISAGAGNKFDAHIMYGLVSFADLPFNQLNYMSGGGTSSWTRARTGTAVGSSGGSVSSSAMVTQYSGSTTLTVPVNAQWASQGYLLSSLTVSFKSAGAFAPFARPKDAPSDTATGWDGGSLVPGAILSSSPKTASPCFKGAAAGPDGPNYGESDAKYAISNGDTVTRTWRAVGPRAQTSGGAWPGSPDSYLGGGLVLTIPALSAINADDAYDWKDGKMWVDFTVTAAWAEYPAVGATGNIDVRSDRGDDPLLDRQIFQWQPPSHLWWKIATAFSIVDAAAGTTTAVQWGDAHTFVSAGPSPSLVAGVDGNGAVYNSLFVNNGGAATQTVVDNYLGVNPRPYVPKVFFLVTRGANCVDAKFSFTMSASAALVTGECQSYTDCYDPQDGHPSSESDRDDLSANSVDRFVHCRVVASTASVAGAGLTPTSVCTECASDCDCKAGQYCASDDGVCSNAGLPGVSSPSTWLCDVEAASRRGLCQEKDSDIFGQRCRVNAPATIAGGSWGALYSSGVGGLFGTARFVGSESSFYGITTPDSQEDNAATSADWERADNDGYGSCAAIRYYNASNPGVPAQLNGVARALSWTGTCYNFECRECTEGISMCNSNRQCIDGRWQDRITVDGTQRTYTHNAVAGTLLGLTFMVILLQICVACNVRYTRAAANK